MKDVIRFENVNKNYASKVALTNLSFTVKQGEFVAFLGPNGAGKSTAISLILGLRAADSGSIEVLSGQPRSLEVRKKLGATLQDLDFPQHLKVCEVVHWVATHYACEESEIQNLKSILMLQDFWERETGGLSGGEKRRLGLLLALLANPDLLVLDEPTTGMDIVSRRAMWECIRQFHAKGKTLLLTTHYLDEVEALASRVLIIDQGQLLFTGSVREIRSNVDYKIVKLQVDARVFQDWDGVKIVSVEQGILTALVKDSDQFVKRLVAEKIEFTQLLVQQASLEEAFLAFRK